MTRKRIVPKNTQQKAEADVMLLAFHLIFTQTGNSFGLSSADRSVKDNTIQNESLSVLRMYLFLNI